MLSTNPKVSTYTRTEKCRCTSMLLNGLTLTIPLFEQLVGIHTLDQAHTVLSGSNLVSTFFSFAVFFAILWLLQQVCLNPLNPELNPICSMLALLGAHHFLHVSRIRVKLLTFSLLMSYIYMEHLFLMFLDHTQRRSTVGRTPLDE